MTAIRVACVFDESVYETPQEEVELLRYDLVVLGVEPNIIKVAASMTEITGSYDLLVIDYGGLSARGNTASANAQIWKACKYAEDHPGALVVIWTRYTADVYERELRAEFAGVQNIVARFEGEESAYSTDAMRFGGPARFRTVFQKWFGVTSEPVQGTL